MSPFLQLPAAKMAGGGKDTTRKVSNPSAVLSNPKHFSLSQPEMFVSLSLSLGGSQVNIFTLIEVGDRPRVEVNSLQKGERLAGRGQQNNLAILEKRAFTVTRSIARAPTNQSIAGQMMRL